MIRVIPVIDLAQGRVVHARRGERSRYAPLQSQLTSSTQFDEVAQALREFTGSDELYVADLDAIEGSGSHRELILQANWTGTLLLDHGVRTTKDLALYRDIPLLRQVVGSETLSDRSVLATAPQGSIFSLDLDHGSPRGPVTAHEAIQSGITTMILLDLAVVGSESGPNCLELGRSLRSEFPNLELIAGGGVRNRDDLERLAGAGFQAALVATALHQGVRLTR